MADAPVSAASAAAEATQQPPYAWAVEAPDGFVSLFLDHDRAVSYAARCRGIVIPLFDLR